VLLYTVFHPGLRRTAQEGLGEVIVLDEAARARKTS
jgi:hypothetical protein